MARLRGGILHVRDTVEIHGHTVLLHAYDTETVGIKVNVVDPRVSRVHDTFDEVRDRVVLRGRRSWYRWSRSRPHSAPRWRCTPSPPRCAARNAPTRSGYHPSRTGCAVWSPSAGWTNVHAPRGGTLHARANDVGELPIRRNFPLHIHISPEPRTWHCLRRHGDTSPNNHRIRNRIPRSHTVHKRGIRCRCRLLWQTRRRQCRRSRGQLRPRGDSLRDCCPSSNSSGAGEGTAAREILRHARKY